MTQLEDGHTVHLVKGGKPPGAATTPAPTASSTTTTANAPTSAGRSSTSVRHTCCYVSFSTRRTEPRSAAVGGGASAAAANPFASMLGGMGAGMGMGGGMPGMPAGGMNMMGPVLQVRSYDAHMISLVHSLVTYTTFRIMLKMLASNPALMEQMLTNNPMLAQMGIDPAHMRQMMSDPMVGCTQASCVIVRVCAAASTLASSLRIFTMKTTRLVPSNDVEPAVDGAGNANARRHGRNGRVRWHGRRHARSHALGNKSRRTTSTVTAHDEPALAANDDGRHARHGRRTCCSCRSPGPARGAVPSATPANARDGLL